MYQGHDRTFWIDNGGEWYKNHDFYAVRDLCEWASNLPYAGEVIIGDHKIGMTHAEVVCPSSITGTQDQWFVNEDISWGDTVALASEAPSDNKYYEERREYVMIFNREVAKHNINVEVDGVDAVLHGHTVESGLPPIRGNQIYLDGGAAFAQFAGGEQHSLNILEYAPSDDAILGLFKLYQFYYNEDGHLDIR